MKKNVGNIDKLIRVAVSIILLVLFFTNTITGTLGIIGLIIAGVFTLTAIVGTCPVYSILGASTCTIKPE